MKLTPSLAISSVNKVGKCRKCGTIFDLRHFKTRGSRIKQTMQEMSLCYDCAFWLLFFQERKYKKKDYEIVDGHVYVVNNVEAGDDIVYIIKEKYFLHIDDHTVAAYNDVSYIGVLPDNLRRLHKDTAYFITKRIYNKVSALGNTYSCPAKGCYDRYHCFFYHPEEHEKNGSFNKIPEDWHVGSEHCPNFANKNDIQFKVE